MKFYYMTKSGAWYVDDRFETKTALKKHYGVKTIEYVFTEEQLFAKMSKESAERIAKTAR